MFDSFLTSIFASSSSLASDVSAAQFILCCVASMVCGALIAAIYMFRHAYSKNFVVTLALLPLVVQITIALVNGNLGTGVAVMGVFNLVRFRSIPGSAKDIASVFVAMGVGLATGMGYIGVAVILVALVGLLTVVYTVTSFGTMGDRQKTLKITIPEDLQYEGLFDTILDRYAVEHTLTEVSTASMGSLFQLRYQILMREPGLEKQMIDELRCRNGNLKISCGTAAANKDVL